MNSSKKILGVIMKFIIIQTFGCGTKIAFEMGKKEEHTFIDGAILYPGEWVSIERKTVKMTYESWKNRYCR